MSEQSQPGVDERLVQQVTDAVDRHPIVDAPREDIAARAEAALAPLVDAPVQGFVPVLAEREVVQDLVESRGAAAQEAGGRPADAAELPDAEVGAFGDASEVAVGAFADIRLDEPVDDTVNDDPVQDTQDGAGHVPAAVSDVPAAGTDDVRPSTSVPADGPRR